MATPNNEKPIIVAFTLDFETGGLDCQDCACTQIAIHGEDHLRYHHALRVPGAGARLDDR